MRRYPLIRSQEMYRYDSYDHRFVAERVAQFRDQTRRFLAGELTEDEFRPLRLQNGLYIQKYAPMLRVAIPYGLLSSTQVRKLAHIGRKYDRGYGHFTTRQNIQFNWPRLEDVPDILAELATVEMHAIQTSGNCVRNITSDHFAGVAADEVVDPRAYCELFRQWSMFHPEFAYLPRKFKIAVCGSATDRAATLVHDIGVHAVRNATGEIGFRVLVGGGLGRTPMIGHVIREFLPREEILNYLDAILRVYNRFGRRDNKYKARIKILVKEMTPEVFARHVEADCERLKGGPATVPDEEIARLSAFFVPPPYERLRGDDAGFLAELADAYSFGGLRVSHEQNLIFADVSQSALLALWGELKALGFATPNIGLLTDIICCPGGDFCSLANAKSIPIAEAIQRRFDDLDYLHDIGSLDLNISGCMNSCGHHHIGHIGILGVDKNGSEWYQVSVAGSDGSTLSGAPVPSKVIGPSF